MSVYKRQDRKQRPWSYEFRGSGTLYKQSGFGTMKEAQESEAAARVALKQRKTRLEFLQIINQRLKYVEAYFPNSLRQNITRLKKFRDWTSLDISEITTDMVRDRMIGLSKEMSNANANKHLVALRSVFEYELNNGSGVLGRNPCRGVRFLPAKKFVKYVPPVEDIQKVLELAGEMERTYLLTIWQLAGRVREINNLTWEDVDFTRRQVRLWTRKKSGGNMTPRLVDMNDKAFNSLKFAQWNRNPHSPYVFTNPLMAKKHPHDPARWKYDYRDKFFDRLCRLAGVKEMGYHALRHQKASELADRGESLPYIRDFLGHEDISTTSLYLQSLGIKK